jgi:twinkle protein
VRIDDKSLWGNGAWIGKSYVLETCPICRDECTFRFQYNGLLWGCPSCARMGDWDELKAILAQRDDWMDRLQLLDAPEPAKGLIQVSEYYAPERTMRVPTGFSFLDSAIGGLIEGGLTVLTGKRGDGKSTFASQLALNAINGGTNVCFYSGELNAGMFQNWMFVQAAGPLGVEEYRDGFGDLRYRVRREVERKVRAWLKDRLVLSDNETTRANEHKEIFRRFQSAMRDYGCRLLFIDNLMAMNYAGGMEDFYRRQSAFIGEIVDFCLANRAHVVLVAHPRKGEWGDQNDQVAGIADITNRASNVVRIARAKDPAVQGCTNIVSVTKNREYGTTGNIQFDYEPKCRRFLQKGGSMVTRFAWEDLG